MNTTKINDRLSALLSRTQNHRVYIEVHRASASGMTRYCKVYIVVEGVIEPVTHLLRDIFKWNRADMTIALQGGGYSCEQEIFDAIRQVYSLGDDWGYTTLN